MLTSGDRMAVGIAYSQGLRPYMQDCFAIVFQYDLDPQVDFVGVFDGHDVFGERVAQYLAENLSGFVLEKLIKNNYRKKISVIQQAFLDFDQHMSALPMLEDVDNEVKGGSTAVCLWIRNNTIISANTGDSRAIMSINRQAVPITSDHKPYNRKEMLRISKAGGFVAGNRVQGVLAVSRSFGDYMFKKNPDVGFHAQMVTALPDVRIFEMDQNMEFIVLGSDGIWDVLSNQDIVDLIWEQIRQNKTLEDISYSVMKRCIASPESTRSGGRDNVTVLICVPLKKNN